MFASMIFVAAAAVTAQDALTAEPMAAGSIPPELFERAEPPRGSLEGLFRGDDYPSEAIVRSQQGTTRVVLLVSDTGLVTDCFIEVSSGSAALDAKTCEVLSSRARFEPARDKAGRAVASAVRERIRWVMMETVTEFPRPAVHPRLLNLEEVITPDDYPALAILKEEQGRVLAGIFVDEEGRAVHCSIVTSSGSAALDTQTCRLLLARAEFEPARDDEGRPVKAAVVQPVTWLLEGEQVINPSTAWSERIITRFSPAGAPLACEIEVVGIEVDAEDPLECEVEELGPGASVPTVGGLPPVISSAIEETRFLPGERIDPNATRTAAGDKLVMRRFVKLTIGTDGRVIDCREEGWDGLIEPPPGACDLVPGLFEPFRNANGEQVVGTGTMIFSIYVRAEVLS